MIRGIGVDIVSVRRIEQAMRNPRFLPRILTPDEMSLELNPMRVASRWAAKEAVYKALGGGISWQDLSILNDTRRAPIVIWNTPIPAMDNAVMHLSLSHEADSAIAFAILEDR